MNLSPRPAYGNDRPLETTDPREIAMFADTTSTSGDDDILGSLLADALRQSEERKATKLARKTLAKGTLSAAENAEITAKVAEWESRHEWTSTHLVYVYEKTVCALCRRESWSFAQMMLRQQHRTDSYCKRLTRLPERAPVPSLPRMTRYTLREAPTCHVCDAARMFVNLLPLDAEL